MAIELSKLIKKVEHKDITLIAGKKGLNNLVTWVHMVENVEATRFLDGGEIAIVTGIGISSSDALYDFLKRLYEKKIAGVIVNIGPFIEEVPPKCIEYCDNVGLPIYIVPWKVHLAEIIRILSYSITKEDQRMFETEAAFKNAIYFPKQEELYVIPLSQRKYNASWSYSAAVLHIDSKQKKMEERLETIANIMEHSLRRKYSKFSCFVNDLDIIVVVANVTTEEHHEIIYAAIDECQGSLSKGEKLTIGVGRMTKSIRCLYKSYNQAKSIQKLHEKGKISKNQIFYSDMGFYRLLMGFDDMEVIKEYYECTLGPLVEYDSVNQTDFCDVLKYYLNHDGSVKETADAMFVHRNTINYKLNRIEEILDIDLSSLSIRLELLVAFTVYDIIS